jgi:restriction system protein
MSNYLLSSHTPIGNIMTEQNLILPHGGFRKMKSFQTAQLVYDATVLFCNQYIDKKSRTHDQMVQAARSGVQNIAEGSLAAATSKKFELKLTSVARASLGELLLDYEDFLRQRNLRQWRKDEPEAIAVRGKFRDLSDRSDQSDNLYSDPYNFNKLPKGQFANTLICLINQASYLLWQQIKTLEKDFVEKGGFTERMYTIRKSSKK